MTYLAFHAVFILPPLVVLLFLAARVAPALGPRARWAMPAVVLIALVYTTPWDNYLVWRGVWYYGADRVLGTIGWVPIEEYMFFVLQPLLTGGWTYLLLARLVRGRVDLAATGSELAPPTPQAHRLGRAVGAAVYAAATLVGALALGVESGVYGGLILVWAAPVLGAQWWFAGPAALRAPRTFLLAVGVPTLYLWAADWYAIASGIWTIAPRYTTGLHLVGLPAEEALFFLVTNLLVVQGLLLFLTPGLPVLGGAPAARGLQPDSASAHRAHP